MLNPSFLAVRAECSSSLVKILAFFWIFVGFCATPALSTQPIEIDGKSYSIGLPQGLCEGSTTTWGIAYRTYLYDLGVAADAKPSVISIFADCGFVLSPKQNGPPSAWGYIAYDNSVGKYWFGQKSLNKRMKREVEKLVLHEKIFSNLKELTNSSLEKIKSTLSIGDIIQVGEPIQDQKGFLVSAVALIGSGKEAEEVYLSTVTFLRNRQIVTFAIYKRADNKSNLDQVRSIAEKFLKSLSHD